MRFFFFPLLLFTLNLHAGCWYFDLQRLNIDIQFQQLSAKKNSNHTFYFNALGRSNPVIQEKGLMKLGCIEKKGVEREVILSEPGLSILDGASLLQDIARFYPNRGSSLSISTATVCKLKRRLLMKYAKKIWHIYRVEPLKRFFTSIKKSPCLSH